MADAVDLESTEVTRLGSSPSIPTKASLKPNCIYIVWKDWNLKLVLANSGGVRLESNSQESAFIHINSSFLQTKYKNIFKRTVTFIDKKSDLKLKYTLDNNFRFDLHSKHKDCNIFLFNYIFSPSYIICGINHWGCEYWPS